MRKIVYYGIVVQRERGFGFKEVKNEHRERADENKGAGQASVVGAPTLIRAD